MNNPTTLKQRYFEVRRRIADAARRVGRRPQQIMLVAVTKFAQPEQIRELIELGHADFAENRVQNLAKRVAAIDEFLQRHHTLTSSRNVRIPDRVRWHMIGHLQRNKVKKVADLVALIHTVDTLRLAEEIQDAAAKLDHPVDVLVQINASHEPSKFGCAIPATHHLAETIDTMVGLRLRGIMTMAPLTDDRQRVRATFERTQNAFAEIRTAGLGGKSFNILSMGMSNDFQLAINCGANVVRIGTAIFGPKKTSDDPADESSSQDDPDPDPPIPTTVRQDPSAKLSL